MKGIKIFTLLFIGGLLAGCVSENGVDELVYPEHIVGEVSVFLSAEDSSDYGRPTAIKARPGGLYFIDSGQTQISRTDLQGNLEFSFGSRGEGPGEFLSITVFWLLGDTYLVYDYNNFKFSTFDQHGSLLKEEILSENPVNPGSGRSIPITVEALSEDKLLIPTGGSEGSLFAITEPGGGDVIYAGNALGEFQAIYDRETVMQAYSRGEIPGILKNLVMIGVSSSAIYSLQQTTGVLEKFTHSGEQIWELELNIPGQDGLLEQISQYNIEAVRNNEPTQMFIHARAMDASEEGVAMLLNMPEIKPAVVAWVPADGSGVEIITIENLELNKFGFMGMFTLSIEDQTAYYLERDTGTVYQFEWPL